jgi:hypothetical protein
MNYGFGEAFLEYFESWNFSCENTNIGVPMFMFGWYSDYMKWNKNKRLNICICYLDVNWLIPKISACRARIWSLLASERSERVTHFIYFLNIYQIRNCRVSNINTHRPTKIYLSQFLTYICIFAAKIPWFKIFRKSFPKTVVHR